MASAVYPKALEAFANADIDLLVDDIRAILIDAADYTYSAAHQFLSSVPGAARVSVSGALTGKTTVNGAFDHAQGTFTTPTGDPCEALIYYKHTGSDATARLIAYMDNFAGLPITPNGQNINFSPSTGANKLFKL
jgi:hypothetical protein